jgi:FtsH-binding integral membrane protein
MTPAHACPIDRPCPRKTWAAITVAAVATLVAVAIALASQPPDFGTRFRLGLVVAVAALATGFSADRIRKSANLRLASLVLLACTLGIAYALFVAAFG